MTDKKKLTMAMVRAGENQRTLAAKLGMLTTSLNYRINGRLPFKCSEVRQIANILGLEDAEIIGIFFAPEVDKMSTGGAR